MNHIIEHDDGTNAGKLVENNVDIHRFQEFYHSITGKRKKLEESFDGLNQFTLSEFETLHHSLLQTISGYTNLVMQNHNVKITYTDSRTSVFDDFESFRVQATAGSVPTKLIP